MFNTLTYVIPTISSQQDHINGCYFLGSLQIYCEDALFMHPAAIAIFSSLVVVKDQKRPKCCDRKEGLKLSWFIPTIVVLLALPIGPAAVSFLHMGYRGIRCWPTHEDPVKNRLLQMFTYYIWAILGTVVAICFGVRILVYIMGVKRNLVDAEDMIGDGILLDTPYGVPGGKTKKSRLSAVSRPEKDLLLNFVVLLVGTLVAVVVAILNEFVFKDMGHSRAYAGWNEVMFIVAFGFAASAFNRKYFTPETYRRFKEVCRGKS